MVKAYLRYEHAAAFGVIASGASRKRPRRARMRFDDLRSLTAP